MDKNQENKEISQFSQEIIKVIHKYRHVNLVRLEQELRSLMKAERILRHK